MYALPLIFNDKWCTMPPSDIMMDHNFGVGLNLDELLSSIFAVKRPSADSRPTQEKPTPTAEPSTTAPTGANTTSTVSTHKDKFQVHLDVQEFTPEEITVKITGDNIITVEGKHEEKEDEHGSVLRHFIRRYTLPAGHDINNVVSNLSSDGVLSITAPLINQERDEHRTIPVQQTGIPSKPLEN